MLLLQVHIGLIGLLEKLRNKRFDMNPMRTYRVIFSIMLEAGRSTHLAVGRILFQMYVNALSDLEQPAPLGL